MSTFYSANQKQKQKGSSSKQSYLQLTHKYWGWGGYKNILEDAKTMNEEIA